MNPTHFLSPELRKEIEIPAQGLATKTLHDDSDVKVVLFAFAAGHELASHTAPAPVTLYFVDGEATLTVAGESRTMRAGGFAHMEPHLTHAILAQTPLVMALVMIKGLKRPPS
jgi:quercetin dioxygenase-like cupin family protein